MLNKLLQFIRSYDMIHTGDHIICAVSGGADSIALLFALKLLKDKLGIQLSAVHFNHHLRGKESQRDANFVSDFCAGYNIPLFNGEGNIVAGKKGLEAAAREARYAYFASLPGIVATAHTADDNAETVLMNMIRGTGLKGLGGISPIKPNLIRPMLSVTREEVIAFLNEYHIQHIEDSSNATDAFLRNRLRHHIMPLLKQENPRFFENTSDMALRLREDEKMLSDLTMQMPDVSVLQKMDVGQRNRYLFSYLKECGVLEPETEHVKLLNKLVISNKPSAKAQFPNGVCISRVYDRLEVYTASKETAPVKLKNPGVTIIEEFGVRVECGSTARSNCEHIYFVDTCGELFLRSRKTGDEIRLPGGTKSLKRLLIDRKVPAAERDSIAVISDDKGVLGVIDIGVNLDRVAGGDRGTYICIDRI